MRIRVLAVLMVPLLAVAVAVQYNDPDPLRWMLAYAVPLALSAGAAAGRFWPRPAALLFALYLGIAAWWLPPLLHAREEAFTHWHMLSAGDEEAREAGGLLICAAWLGALARFGRRR